MKKISTLLALILSIYLNAQTQNFNDFSRSTLNFNIGATNVYKNMNVGYESKTALPNLNLGYRFSFNSRFGLMAAYSFNPIKVKSSSQTISSTCQSFSIEGVSNIGSLLNFTSFSNKINLFAHLGTGYSYSTSSLNNRDQMIFIRYGLFAMFKINNKIALNLDYTIYNNLLQTTSFDLTSKVISKGFDGKMHSISIGINYTLGKKQANIDWAEYQHPDYKKLTEYEERIVKATATLEKSAIPNQLNPNPALIENPTKEQLELQLEAIKKAMADTDQDGIPDYLDLEPNTPAGVKVDKQGKQIK